MSFSSAWRWLSIPLVLTLALGLGPLATASSPAVQGAQGAASALPNTSTLLFVENVGQFPAEARFQVRNVDQGALWLAEDALWVVQSAVALRLSFPGANPRPRLEPFDRLPTAVNYYRGNDPAHWYTNVPVWGGVRYVNLYPGVDLEITGQGKQFAWRLMCRADCQSALQQTRLQVEGAADATVAAGYLRLATAAGELNLPLLTAPDAAISGSPTVRRTAPETFDVTAPFASTSPNSQSPNLPTPPSPNPQSPAALPGSLLFSTFLGADNDDEAHALAVNGDGETYVTGNTYSPGFPTTPGAFDPTLDGENEMFVTKLNASGSGLVYSTFLGGSVDAGDPPDERAWDIVVDGGGAAYITGETRSDDFPTTPGAFDTTYNPGYALPGDPPEANPFVTKLDSSGALAYSTYLGPSSEGKGIAVDGAGMIYVIGRTGSEWFPTTEGAYDRSLAFSGDFFVLELNPAGQGQSDLLYSTYVGMGAQDYAEDIAVDGAGVVHVIGYTEGEFPTTPGAYDATFNGALPCQTVPCPTNVVFFKLDPAGNGAADLLYSTYLDGTATINEQGYGIAVDAAGVVYLTGATWAEDFPTTTGAYDTTYNGFGDVFVSKLNPTGNGAADLLYSTYLGGSYLELFGGQADIAVDDAGDIYVTGRTYSPDFPVTPGAFQCTRPGDVFVTRLRPGGAGQADLVYSTYLGGDALDYGRGIVIGPEESVYLTGYTNSSDFPTTAGAYDATFGGGTCGSDPCYDAFVARLSVEPLDTIAKDSDPPAGTAVDYGQTITYTLGMAVPTMQQLTFYDAVPTYTTYLTGSLVAPAEITYDPTTEAFSGTFILAANTLVTIRFAVQVAITGAAQFAPDIVNRACVYPAGGGLTDCEWSNEVRHLTYGGLLFLPLVTRNSTP